MSMPTVPQCCLQAQRPRWEEISLPKPASPETQPKPPIRVLVVDDHPVVLLGVASCFSRHSRLRVIGQASDGQEAISKSRGLSPDVVLMDITMPNMGGLPATLTIRRENPSAKILVLTVHDQPDCLLSILRSGVNGCVLKNAPTADLVQAIETVHAGGSYFSPEVRSRALECLTAGNRRAPGLLHLNDPERDVLIAIADGLSAKEIASRLNIAERTVETHRTRLSQKLKIRSIAGLTRFAYQKGLISVSGTHNGMS